MAEKPPYRLTIKLDSPKPEHVAAALAELPSAQHKIENTRF